MRRYSAALDCVDRIFDIRIPLKLRTFTTRQRERIKYSNGYSRFKSGTDRKSYVPNNTITRITLPFPTDDFG